MKALKLLFAETILYGIQTIVLLVWQLGAGAARLTARGGKSGYLTVVRWRRRLKGEDEWNENDWTYLGVPPPENHPRAATFYAHPRAPQ